jgi:hypothetical protein
MAARRRHSQRFWEARIWLTVGATLASAGAVFVAWDRGSELANAVYDATGIAVSNGWWALTGAWLAATAVAGLSVPFMVGRSLRTGAALALAAAALGVVGVKLAGYQVDFTGVQSHGLFEDPTRKWQLALLWIVPAALLVTAAVLAIVDYVAVGRGSGRSSAPRDPRKPTPGNEALHWSGSTYAGVGAKSNARERY